MASTPMHHRAFFRALTALAVGVITGVLVAPALGLAAALVAGWAAVCITSVIWILAIAWPMDAARTRAHATADDPGRAAARLVAVIGSIASLGAVAVVLIQTRTAGELVSYLLAGTAVVAVAASWALIQLDYMLRIAAVYYSDPVGGIDFHQSEDPMYSDFAYVSFGLGMTYQIADTDLGSNRLRRIVLAQTLLAYLFGAVILATVINLVTNLG
jgi:uncharacterized membrane protein